MTHTTELNHHHCHEITREITRVIKRERLRVANIVGQYLKCIGCEMKFNRTLFSSFSSLTINPKKIIPSFFFIYFLIRKNKKLCQLFWCYSNLVHTKICKLIIKNMVMCWPTSSLRRHYKALSISEHWTRKCIQKGIVDQVATWMPAWLHR